MGVYNVNWGTSPLTFAGVQRVYTRQRWSDAWTFQGNLWCEQASWTVLPAIPTAQLVLHYGTVIAHGGTGQQQQAKLNIRGYYVRIQFDAGDGTLTWYGFVDEVVDEKGGSSGDATGKQTFICYGMVQMLAHHFMIASKWWDQPNTAVRTSGSSIPFNENGRPNRTKTIPESGPSHMFIPRAPINTLAGGVKPFDEAQFWSTQKILKYIEQYLSPVDKDGTRRIPIRFDALTLAPDWDRPTIETEGRSVLSLIYQLINPDRMLLISTTVDEAPATDEVVLKLHSTSGTAFNLPNGVAILANADSVTLATEAAQDTHVVIQSSTSELVHQVVCRGAKRQTCLTVQVQQGAGTEEGLAEGWTIALEDDYEAGGSNEVGYDALSLSEKWQLNHLVRSRAEFEDVYSTFVLYPKWNRAVNTTPGSLSWVFQQPNKSFDEGATPPDPEAEKYVEYFPYWSAIKISPVLPFKENFDYTGKAPPEDDLAETEFRTPYVLFQRPMDGHFLQAEKMSDGDNPQFSVGVDLTKDEQGLKLDVLGTWQHVIADTAFVGVPADPDFGGLPDYDYFDAYFTISLTDDRFAEARYPEDKDLPANIDVIRRLVLYVGDGYEMTRVLDGTSIDIDNAGARVTTDPDLTTEGDFLRNSFTDLESVARSSFVWFGTDRKVVRLSSARPTSLIAPGMMVVNVDGELNINTVLTEITMSSPLGEDLQVQESTYALTTGLGELDPLAYAPDPRRSRLARVRRAQAASRARAANIGPGRQGVV